MSMRQYIGARYTPKFMGTYDATQAYEALSVVDNGLGTSYICDEPLNPGVPLTDPKWHLYGASSGAIISLQNQIDDMKDGTVPGSLQNQINEMNDGTVPGSLQDQINDNASDIATLANKINGNILVIGNSYVGNGCVDTFVQLFEHNYKYIGSGTGFTTYTGHSTNFESFLDTAIADSAFDNDTITDVIFVSAMGDTRAYGENAGTYKTALDTTLSSIKTKIAANFPKCERVMVTLAEAWNAPYFSDNKFVNLFKVHHIFKEACVKYSFDYLGWSGFQNLFVSARIQADNYHPNATGAEFISNFIKSAYYGHIEYTAHTFAGSANYYYTTAATTGIVLAKYTPDMGELCCRGITSGTGTVLLTNGDIFLDTDSWATPCPPPFDEINLVCPVYDNSGNQHQFLRLQLTSDTNGCLCIKAMANPTVGTVASTQLQIPNIGKSMYFT